MHLPFNSAKAECFLGFCHLFKECESVQANLKNLSQILSCPTRHANEGTDQIKACPRVTHATCSKILSRNAFHHSALGFINKLSTEWTASCQFVILMYSMLALDSGFACQQPFSLIVRPKALKHIEVCTTLTGNKCIHQCIPHPLTV